MPFVKVCIEQQTYRQPLHILLWTFSTAKRTESEHETRPEHSSHVSTIRKFT
jgi:hypothetical protein